MSGEWIISLLFSVLMLVYALGYRALVIREERKHQAKRQAQRHGRTH